MRLGESGLSHCQESSHSTLPLCSNGKMKKKINLKCRHYSDLTAPERDLSLLSVVLTLWTLELLQLLQLVKTNKRQVQQVSKFWARLVLTLHSERLKKYEPVFKLHSFMQNSALYTTEGSQLLCHHWPRMSQGPPLHSKALLLLLPSSLNRE